MTRDIDVVVVVDAGSGRAFLDALDSDDIYLPADMASEAIENGGSFNILHPASGGKVDVFVVDNDDAFTRSRMERRVRADVIGIDAWIASAEDVVLAKLRWRLESRSEVQWRDCVEIAAVSDLDANYLRRWAGELGIEADLAELLNESAPEA